MSNYLESVKTNRIIKLKLILEIFEKVNMTDIKSKIIIQNLKTKFQFNHNKVTKSFIYIIRIEGIERNELISKYKLFKESNKPTSYFNKNSTSNDVIYVGSSQSIVSRINQHLGHTGAKLYSLHLKDWLENHDINLKIELLHMDGEFHDLTNEIEFGIWDELQPLFGKKGVNLKQSSLL